MKARRGTKQETLQVRVVTAEKRILEAYAAQQGVTTSDVLRRLVSEFLKAVQIQHQQNRHPNENQGVAIGGR